MAPLRLWVKDVTVCQETLEPTVRVMRSWRCWTSLDFKSGSIWLNIASVQECSSPCVAAAPHIVSSCPFYAWMDPARLIAEEVAPPAESPRPGQGWAGRQFGGSSGFSHGVFLRVHSTNKKNPKGSEGKQICQSNWSNTIQSPKPIFSSASPEGCETHLMQSNHLTLHRGAGLGAGLCTSHCPARTKMSEHDLRVPQIAQTHMSNSHISIL